jgi:tetratricopeptide (TPR) repeat protein
VRKTTGTGSSGEPALGELLGLSDLRGRKEYLRRHPQLLQPCTVERLAESVREKVRINLDEALRAAEVALEIAEHIGHRNSIAWGLRAKANALHFLGQNIAAADLHQKAVALFESDGDAKELGRTLSSSIQPLILLGEYDRALAAAHRAQEIFNRSGDRLRLARLQINVGNIYHRQDRFSDALPCYEEAYNQLLPLNETEGIASSLHNIAVCLISLNDFRRAAATYERARAFCEEHDMPLAVVQADYNIAYLHYLRGEYSLAMDMLRATRDKAERAADPYHAALCRLDLADIYLELNLIGEAVDTAQEAFERFQQLGMRYEGAKALTGVAIALGRLHESRRAAELLVQARDVFGKERNSVWPSIIDLYCAVILFNDHQYDQSRALCLKALESFETAELPQRVILCRLMLVRLHLYTGKVQLASSNCLRALRQLKSIEAPFLAYQAHFLMGQVHEANQDYPAAYGAYQLSRELLETLRSNLHREELKIAFVQDRVEVYERLVKICLRRRSAVSTEEAFRYIEEAKSPSLRDVISRQCQVLASNEIDESEPGRRIRDLREALNWYYHRIECEHLSADGASLERRRRFGELAQAREKELIKLLREMPDSEVGESEFRRPKPVSLREVRVALGPDAALVEFFRVGSRFLGAVITADGYQIIPVANIARVKASMALLQFQLSKLRLGTRYTNLLGPPLLRAAQAHLLELYEQLLAPLRHLLRARRLIFVPHDMLHYLPFHALFDGRQYLIDSYTISYAPSASVLALCCQKSGKAGGRPLILGVPDARAPNILPEVEVISTILADSELFVGESANEETLREKGPSSPFIHIATHAYFRQDNPLFSGIRLGTSYLTLLDVYRLNLPALLVTLSGCATGMSVVAGGDELLGLVRGFLCAGAQSLLLTLWDVHDAATTLFMKSFYIQLSQCQDRALALQRAMLDLREDYPHPYYWAPFLLVGKSRPEGP